MVRLLLAGRSSRFDAQAGYQLRGRQSLVRFAGPTLLGPLPLAETIGLDREHRMRDPAPLCGCDARGRAPIEAAARRSSSPLRTVAALTLNERRAARSAIEARDLRSGRHAWSPLDADGRTRKRRAGRGQAKAA